MLVNSDPRNGASNHKPDCMRRQTTARNNLLHGTAATHWPLHPPRRRGCLLFSCVSSRQRRASWAARAPRAPIETLAVCPRRAVFPIRLRTLCTPHAHRAARYARHVPPCTYTERPPAGGWAAAVRVRPSNPSPGGPSLPAPLPKPQGGRRATGQSLKEEYATDRPGRYRARTASTTATTAVGCTPS
jgi:hypothetical protein